MDQNKPRNAKFKCLIYFKDDNKRTFYSRDTENDPNLVSFKRLVDLVDRKFKDKHRYAAIYLNKPGKDGPPMAEWKDGERIT